MKSHMCYALSQLLCLASVPALACKEVTMPYLLLTPRCVLLLQYPFSPPLPRSESIPHQFTPCSDCAVSSEMASMCWQLPQWVRAQEVMAQFPRLLGTPLPPSTGPARAALHCQQNPSASSPSAARSSTYSQEEKKTTVQTLSLYLEQIFYLFD